MPNVFSFEERERIIRQQQIIDELGKDFIEQKRIELCYNCHRQDRCRLIPNREGCCYHDPIRTIVVDEPVNIEDAPFLVEIDEMIQRGTISAIIEPEDKEWEEL